MTAAGLAGGVALGSKLVGARNPMTTRNGRAKPLKSVSRGIGSAGKDIGKGIGKAGKGIGKAGKEIGSAGVTLGVGDVTMDMRRGRKEAAGRRQSPLEVLLSGLTSRKTA